MEIIFFSLLHFHLPGGRGIAETGYPEVKCLIKYELLGGDGFLDINMRPTRGWMTRPPGTSHEIRHECLESNEARARPAPGYVTRDTV